MNPVVCPACNSNSCRSVPGGPSSPVRCFLLSEEVARRADEAVGWNHHIQSVFYPNPVVKWQPWMYISRLPCPRGSPDFLNLPSEIIFQIIGSLSGIDKFALRIVCRRFFSILHDTRPPYLLDDCEKEALWKISLRDSFNRGCSLEKRRLLDRQSAMCSSCMVSHRRKAFTNDQLSQPPESRSCRCTTETVQLCVHKDSSIPEILGLFRKDIRSRPKKRIYTMQNPLFCSELSHRSHAPNIPPQVGVKNGLAYIYWKSVLPSIYNLHTALIDLEAKFCPHLTPVEICQRIFQRHSGLKKVWKRGTFVTCSAIDCSTEVTLEPADDLDMIVSVYRYFDAGRPDSPEILAQLTTATYEYSEPLVCSDIHETTERKPEGKGNQKAVN